MPTALGRLGESKFACSTVGDRLDRARIAQARALLEACMLRRVKADVEATLPPKLEFVLRPPLTPLQRRWYRVMA